MRILLDECVPARLKTAFPGHAVRTVAEIGWRSAKDGPLLKFAETRYDVFVTIDGKLERQNDLAQFNLSFVIVRVPDSQLKSFQPLFADLAKAVERARPGEIIHLSA